MTDQHPGRGETPRSPEAADILERDPALDGVRGFALCMVLAGHGLGVAPSGAITQGVHVLMDSMQVSLDLFFVLSGFLITSILIRTRESGRYFVNFYARRVLRIFPAYYIVLGGVFLLRPLLFGPAPWHAQMDSTAPYYLLYMQNMVMALRGEGLGWVGLYHTFSLAIEEQYYLLWPAIVWLTPKDKLARVCLLLAAGSIAIKAVVFASGGSWWNVYMNTFCRLHGLAAGSAIAAALAIHGLRRPPRWLRLAGWSTGALLMVEVVSRIAKLTSWETHGFLLNLTAVPFFAWALFEAIVAARSTVIRRCLESAFLTFVGRYSYGLYLIHAVLLWELRPLLLPAWKDTIGLNVALPLSGVIGIGISLVLAVAMFHWIELPILKLKRYFVPRRQKPAPLPHSLHADRRRTG